MFKKYIYLHFSIYLLLKLTCLWYRFTREDVHSRSNIKSSVQRGLKTKLVSQFEDLAPVIDDLIPKKSQIVQLKWYDYNFNLLSVIFLSSG